MYLNRQKGFTLIELLVVIVIIAILAAIIFVALDPARRFGESRDSRRWSEVVTILNAVLKHQVDQGGVLLNTVSNMTTGDYYMIGTASSGCNTGCDTVVTQNDCVDISGLVDAYISDVPEDPLNGTGVKTYYYISKTANSRIIVGACNPERTSIIEVQR